MPNARWIKITCLANLLLIFGVNDESILEVLGEGDIEFQCEKNYQSDECPLVDTTTILTTKKLIGKKEVTANDHSGVTKLTLWGNSISQCAEIGVFYFTVCQAENGQKVC